MVSKDIPDGVDISSRNGVPDFEAAKQAGLDFVFCKAAEGSDYTNPLFAAQWAAAGKAGVLRGAYLFWRWDVDPTPQVVHFLNTVSATGGWGEFPVTIDVENEGDGAGHRDYPASEAVRRLRVAVEIIKQATGKAPIIYTYASMWRDVLGNPTNFQDCPLWQASYTAKAPKPVGGWKMLTFWQNSSTGKVPGVKTLVDTDIFIGSLDDLRKWAGISDSEPLFFKETGQYVAHGMKDYYVAHQKERNFGFPLTGEFAWTLEDGQVWTCQLFERALLQYLPPVGVMEARCGFMLGKALGIL